jgi:hypothetical protein
MKACKRVKVSDAREAWEFLTSNPEKAKVSSTFGHYRWGDAEAITGSHWYANQIVLVEIRGPKSQYQHWGFRFDRKNRPEVKVTWFTNLVDS